MRRYGLGSAYCPAGQYGYARALLPCGQYAHVIELRLFIALPGNTATLCSYPPFSTIFDCPS